MGPESSETQKKLQTEKDVLQRNSNSIELLMQENRILEKELRTSRSISEALFQFNPIPAIIVDKDGRITGFNKAREAVGSRLPEIGQIMYKDFASKHMRDMYADLIDTIKTGEIRHFPEQKYGKYYLKITIAPFPQGAIITSEDVTQKKLAEEALRISEKEKHLILSSVSEVVCYQDMNYRIKWANQATGNALGVKPDRLIGQTCYSVWLNRESPCENCSIYQGIRAHDFDQMELKSFDGRFWKHTGYPAVDEKGTVTGVVIVMMDITRQKHIQDEKEKIQAELVHAQKMKAIGNLAGGVAHDFNNLITAIQGTIDLVIDRLTPDDPFFQDLTDVHNAAERASDLTRQLLLFSRRHPVAFKPVDLNELINNLLKMLHRLIGEDISIGTSLDPKLWSVSGDSGTIEQVLVNLVVNARDAMPDGGKATIRTENVVIDESYCTYLPEARPGRFIRMTVSDTGLGMDKETQARVFEPFFTTKEPGEGTGLGLSVVYGIVKQHQGWINLYSEVKKGTEFKIYLPASAQSSGSDAASQDDQTSLEGLQGRGERILVVEDEDCVREFTSRALARHGYEIVAAENATSALKLFKEQNGQFDLIFSDVVLPDFSGIDLIGQLQVMEPNLNILVCSGYTDSKSQWSVIQEKGYRFLQKPYSLYDLLCAIRQVMKKG